MKNLKIDDFTKYKFLSNIKYSENSKDIIFIVHEIDSKIKGYLSNIYSYNLENKKISKITGDGLAKNFILLEDGKYLIYFNEGEVKLLNIEEKRVEKNLTVDMKINNIWELGEGEFLFTAENKVGRKENIKGDCVFIDEIPFIRNGVSGYVNSLRNQLYLYTVKTNKCDLITPEFMDVNTVNIKEDKKEIVITGEIYKDKMKIFNHIYIYNLYTKTFERLSPNKEFEYTDAHFSGEDIIFVGRSMENYGVNENVKIYSLNPKTKIINCITKDLDLGMQNIVNTDCSYGLSSFTYTIKKDGNYFYFLSTEGYSAYLNRIDKEGNIERVVKEEGAVCDYSVKNGDISFVAFRDIKLQELYRLKNGKEKQLTQFNQWVIEDRKLSKPEHMLVETDKRIFIDGWIMRPVDFDENKKYPAILNIHGGPKTTYGEIFVHEMQYWANEGYVVFFCNPRGSDGKGDEFADIRGKHGTIDYMDIMKFTDYVVENHSFIDGQRVGVTGGSYGGFMTNWIVGHTNRFKAAVTQRSISNWISNAYSSDIGYFFEKDQHLADPWTNVELIWDHSPLKYADKVRTPLLFIHAEEDYRCELSQAFQFFTAIKTFGVDAEMRIFKGENHELSRSGKPKNRIVRLEEITHWFDKHLK